MFVVVIDRVRQRILTTVRILFLLALVAVVTAQLYGIFKTSLALGIPWNGALPGQAAGSGGSLNPAQGASGDHLKDTLTRELQGFYQGRL